MPNKNLTAKDARESQSQLKDASADNSRQQHPKATELQAQDNSVVPMAYTPPSVDNDKQVRGLPGWLSHTGVTQKGLGQQTAKNPDL